MNAPENRAGNHESDSSFDVVVIGAGQAGLAIGYFLERQGRRFLILEAATRSVPPGASGGTRSPCSRLAATAAFRACPSPAIPTAIRPRRGDRIPGGVRGDVRAPVEEQPGPEAHSRGRGFVLEVDGRTIAADQVVVATGPFQMPYVPEVAERLAPEVFQTHAPATASRATSPRERSWSWAAATPVSRSRRSSRRPTGLSSRSARARHHCRSGSSAATSSGG